MSNSNNNIRTSREIANAIGQKIGIKTPVEKLNGQSPGEQFESAVAQFLRETLHEIAGVGYAWKVHRSSDEPSFREKSNRQTEAGNDATRVSAVVSLSHQRCVAAIANAVEESPELTASIGRDYIIKPDISIFRAPIHSETTRKQTRARRIKPSTSDGPKLDTGYASLHAGISCKLTICGDHSQNASGEVLNLIRPRSCKLPHAVVVTGEPLPSRLSSIALGGSDIDCVYHFALPELLETVKELDLPDSEEALKIMVNEKRLKDISDLPLDLAV